ncbi:molybdate ABC transporter substrate-binding protein [Microbacterium sp. CFH 31415]|uniref:molybdate ABC transporter substrate-binding protein n=1 Tax=Microbacterium sp. CFH 31415 TaxID=2921732 RepID=UPI001F1345DC|nr:molybdate ABC transporter substrate-binding protein [Microbacterium sp. CFH 31415]MCH6229937.1 molybdate ABC transporter substrate-binding protein [Microbacterium sp. CFH 31415]
MPRPGLRPVVASLLVAALALVGCAGAARDAAPGSLSAPAPGVAAPELSGELTIFAAASLRAAFDELAMKFEQRHTSVEVLPISYDGSSTLATQLIEGAPADVFASADEANMQKIVDAGLADEPRLFASNTLVIAVPAGNPGGVTEIDDLAADALTVVLCAPEVPCGAVSAILLERNEVVVTPASLEQNVTGVLTKVAAGEADAGLVYVTDARGEPRVEAVDAEGAADVVNRYPVAALTEAGNPPAAAAFVEFVLSGEGRAVLDELGFGAP